jgi:hypothetical protein
MDKFPCLAPGAALSSCKASSPSSSTDYANREDGVCHIKIGRGSMKFYKLQRSRLPPALKLTSINLQRNARRGSQPFVGIYRSAAFAQRHLGILLRKILAIQKKLQALTAQLNRD